MNIQENLQFFNQKLKPFQATLIAVSKTKPVEILERAYEAGVRDFGENKVQELVSKYETLPKDIHWHLIGHLQRNKVKYIAPFVYLIHSVDSEKLLKEIDKQAQKNERIIDCLLQLHIAEEETKFGLDFQEAEELLKKTQEFSNIQIKGLMGMATFTENQEQIRKEFKSLKTFFEGMKNQSLPENVSLEILSMGMSGDYEIALEEGSTMVRVGSAIFGARN